MAFSADSDVEVADKMDSFLNRQTYRVKISRDEQSDSEDTGTENDDYTGDDEPLPKSYDENMLIIKLNNITIQSGNEKTKQKDKTNTSDDNIISHELRRSSHCSDGDEGYGGEDECDEDKEKWNIRESDSESKLVICLKKCTINNEEGKDGHDNKEEEEEEEIERTPMKGRISGKRPSYEPYVITAHNHHNGGYIVSVQEVAQSTSSRSSQDVPSLTNLPVPVLGENDYISDDMENKLLSTTENINFSEILDRLDFDGSLGLEELFKDNSANLESIENEDTYSWNSSQDVLQNLSTQNQHNNLFDYISTQKDDISGFTRHRSTETLISNLSDVDSQQMSMSPDQRVPGSPETMINSPQSVHLYPAGTYTHYRDVSSTGTPSPLSITTDPPSESFASSPYSTTSIGSPETPQVSNLKISLQTQTSHNIELQQYLTTNSIASHYLQSPAGVTYFQGTPTENTRKLTTIQVPRLQNTPAVERLNLDKEKKRRYFHCLSKLSDEKLCAKDADGDTQLIIAVSNAADPELLFALVHRLKKIPGALNARNNENLSALKLACIYYHHQPLIARLIAEELLAVSQSRNPRVDLLNEEYENGNTIIHWIAERGDDYLDLLVELLSIKDSNGQSAFDINKRNHTLGTPIMMAVQADGQTDPYRQSRIYTSRTIKFLIEQGADLSEKEHCGGMTCLHVAVKEGTNPVIVEIILKSAHKQGIDLVNKKDYQGNTALHYTYQRSDISSSVQDRIIYLLGLYGAVHVTGSQGRMPLALVTCPSRKEHIRSLFHSKKSKRP